MSNRWLSCMLVDTKQCPLSVSEILTKLSNERIEARHIWRPMHTQPLFSGRRYYSHDEETSISDHLFEQGVCLPSGSNMTEGQQERVISTIRDVLK